MLDPCFEVLDKRFASYVMGNVHIDVLASDIGLRWSEGPVWFGDGRYLLWSDIPNNRIMRWDETDGSVSVYRNPSNHTNGHTRDRQGRLVSCEHGGRRVSRTEYDGRVTVLADSHNGKRLNSPNDVVVKSDDTVWFTDPSYGILSEYEGHQSELEQDGCHVYRFDPTSGALKTVATDFVKPNGLAFSPDEKLLYIADTGASHDPDGPKHIRRFQVRDDGTLAGGEVFADCTAGLFDGFRVDHHGNIWTSAADGVHCYTPDGTLIGKIKVPEVVANVCFGGVKKNRLFICATTSLRAVYLNTRGVQTP
ncbi:gluconolactonase [Inquilinus ginsengisoli]|uniref:Gluconolactonase n=1 Tax=Inquilinus ginsengisoli TaxID=363840 RepID=A0ABU1K189_9PROT|nr:SMP-30/gluconolactonase/LRE family protein [Inquilinus ginsengisoli]MDR6294639.1 gluconolactonase [Inquilinus ginsengisoli]